ncbi:MAG: NUDIX domain-containing protein [Lacticaseibacillus absianus]
MEPQINRDKSRLLADTKFIKLYDLEYQDGNHYYDASRRGPEELFAYKPAAELTTAPPDAASAFVIIELPNEAPKLLLFYEFRYPTGSYMLGVPAGLIDPADFQGPDPVKRAMIREIKEETGITVTSKDTVEVISPCVFTTPGFSDESNALVKAIIHLDDLSSLNHKGAEGTEVFGDFRLVDRKAAMDLLKAGRDETGHYLPLITWAALTYFVSGLWQEI